MIRIAFDAAAARSPRDTRLEHVTFAPLTASLAAGAPVQAAVFHVAPGGRIAKHPATVSQILAVLDGSGRVSGGDGAFEPIAAGEAVFWAAGEEHETVSDGGLTALILEGDGLQPYAREG